LKLQKNMAAALIGMSAASMAHAQSSVTLYGILDVGLGYASRTASTTNPQAGGPHQFGLIDSGSLPSLFGIEGKEDLGGGWSANFDLQGGINLTNGAIGNSDGSGGGLLFGRLSWVGISSPYGSVALGRQMTPIFQALVDVDQRASNILFGSGLNPFFDNGAFTGIFNQNAITYRSPEIAGIKVDLLFAPGGVAGDAGAGRQYSASLKYTNGGLLVNAAWYDGNANPTVGPTDVNFLSFAPIQVRELGASYKFSKITIGASFFGYRNKANLAYGGVPTAVNVYNIGANYLIVPTVDVDAGIYYAEDRINSGAHSITGAVSANYFLSKRTSLYAQIGFVNNHASSDGAWLGNGMTLNQGAPSAVGGIAGLMPVGTTVVSNVGIRHLF
jgi:predicted porin